MDAGPDDRREMDETFWQQQEVRLRSCLGQPCCTLSGMCSVLVSMSGRFAVVIHGESDCANSFHLHQGPAAANFFCTCLDEQQVTTGRTQQSLEECLELVVEQHSPEVVFVLGTCLVEMIGDRFERLVERMAERLGVPMRALHTSGLALGSQAEMLDWLFSTLAGLPPIEATDPAWYRSLRPLVRELVFAKERRELAVSRALQERCAAVAVPGSVPAERSLNLIGLPESRDPNRVEPVRVLQQLGMEVNGLYPFGTSLADWRAIGLAGVSVVVDRELYPRLVERLVEMGQDVIEVPLPVGLEQSERFYRLIAEAFGKQQRLEEELAGCRDDARAALESFRRRWSGVRLAMGIRLLNNYRADQLAYEGLGDAWALAEMGLDLTLMVQGPPEQEARKRFAERLGQLGCELPFEVFPDPWNLSERLAAGAFDVAYLADHSREEAAKAGVPMIVSRGLAPYLDGIADNLALLDRLLGEKVLEGR